jgi:hypothetical protein
MPKNNDGTGVYKLTVKECRWMALVYQPVQRQGLFREESLQRLLGEHYYSKEKP